jgi:hypothetical protein
MPIEYLAGSRTTTGWDVAGPHDRQLRLAVRAKVNDLAVQHSVGRIQARAERLAKRREGFVHVPLRETLRSVFSRGYCRS